MNAELLYTSAPQGLKQGSRGFCTVLSTVGMPLNIATKLESLSGYRHLHPSGTPDAAKNPVNHSHLKLTVGGRTLSVISRISDYGLDYSQRTNKLAHHVVVDSPMPTCGPAALLGDPSVIRSEWDGNCVNIPTPPTFPALSVEPAVCQTWESIAGDAGWAGVVANAWLNNASKPIFLIFSEDQSPEILPLIAEAIAMLPPSKRWQATFGTYVTNLPPDVDCKVRCVVAGSDEARMASARGVVIDLTSPCGPAPSSEAATAARNGTFVGARSNVPPSLASGDDDGQQDGSDYEKPVQPGESDFDPDNPSTALSTELPPSVHIRVPRSVKPVPTTGSSRKRRSSISTAAIVTTILSLGLLLPILYFFSSNPFLKGLDIGEFSIELNKNKKEDLVDSTKQEPNVQNEKLSGKSQPQENEASQITPQKGNEISIASELLPLTVDQIVVKLKNSKWPTHEPVAIPGEPIILSVETTEDEPTEIQIAYIESLRKNAKIEYILTSEKSSTDKIVSLDGFEPILPIDIAGKTLQASVSYQDITFKSAPIPIVEKARKEDFELVLSKFVIDGKELPVGLPGSEIFASIAVVNRNPVAAEYLGIIMKTTKFEWRTQTGEKLSETNPSFKTTKGYKGEGLQCLVALPLANTILDAQSPPVVTQLNAKLHLKNEPESVDDLQFEIEDSIPKIKGVQLKYGKFKFGGALRVYQIIVMPEKNALPTRPKNHIELEVWLSRIVNARKYIQELRSGFDSLGALIRQGSNVKLLNGFSDEIRDFGSLEFLDVLNGRNDKQIYAFRERLREYQRLIDVYADKSGPHLAQTFVNANQARPNATEEEIRNVREKEMMERSFVEWLGVDSNPKRLRSISESIKRLAFCIDELHVLVPSLHKDNRFVVEMPIHAVSIHVKKEASKLLDGKDPGSEESEKITEVNLPLIVELIIHK